MSKKYTTKQMAEMLGVTPRTIQRHLATLRKILSPDNKTYDLKVLEMLKAIFDYGLDDNLPTENDNQLTYDRTEYFTEEEFQEFQKRLIEYPLIKEHIENLKAEIEHHKKQYEKLILLHNDFIQAHKSSLKIIEQRNYIEANDKNLK